MSARRWLPFVAGLGVVGAVALSGCGSAERQPLISAVRPSVIAPGGLMMISGRHLDRVVGVSVGGRPAGRFTPVNADLLTAEAPPELADGSHTVELQALDGRRALTMVQAGSGRQPASAPPVIQAPEPTPVSVVAAPTPTPTPAPPAAPAPSAGPFQLIVPARPLPATPRPPQRDNDDDDDEGQDRRPAGPGGLGRGRGR